VYETAGVARPDSSGVQIAGVKVNLEDGVDTEDENSEEVLCDSSESAIGELLRVGEM
jgi:hypothetical protein